MDFCISFLASSMDMEPPL
uniref:Uncharacterized protein n=1 Tax=Arundo donax TaxID=35708 RepID=A0A0A8XPL6_ARUDO